MIDGRLSLDGELLGTGEAAKVTGEVELVLATDVAAELILIDVPSNSSPSVFGPATEAAGLVTPGNRGAHRQVVCPAPTNPLDT